MRIKTIALAVAATLGLSANAAHAQAIHDGLQARLTDVEFARKQHAHFLQPLPALLQRAFKGLGYPQPEMEAQLLLLLVETFWRQQATGLGETSPEFLEFIKAKYQQQ